MDYTTDAPFTKNELLDIARWANANKRPVGDEVRVLVNEALTMRKADGLATPQGTIFGPLSINEGVTQIFIQVPLTEMQRDQLAALSNRLSCKTSELCQVLISQALAEREPDRETASATFVGPDLVPEHPDIHLNTWALVEIMGYRKVAGYVTLAPWGKGEIITVEIPAIFGYELDPTDVPSVTKQPARRIHLRIANLYQVSECTESEARALAKQLDYVPFTDRDLGKGLSPQPAPAAPTRFTVTARDVFPDHVLGQSLPDVGFGRNTASAKIALGYDDQTLPEMDEDDDGPDADEEDEDDEDDQEYELANSREAEGKESEILEGPEGPYALL